MAYVIEFTAAQSGSGKSYRRGPHLLVNDWIPNHKGIHYSNFPLKPEKIADECVKRHNSISWLRKIGWSKYKILTNQEVSRRIHIIPQEELDKWLRRESGPWEYFKDKDIAGARIAIDEAHNYIVNKDAKEWVDKWKEWIGALRHHRVEALEFLSQYEVKLSTTIRNEAHISRDLFNSEKRNDPFFNIVMADWYEMRAKFITGTYTATVWEEEFIKYKGKNVLKARHKFAFEQLYYDMYDSYNNIKTSGTTEGEIPHAFKEHSKFGMILWFLRRHFFNLVIKFSMVAIACWLFFFGGITWTIIHFCLYLQVMATRNAHKPSSSSANTNSSQPLSQNNSNNQSNIPNLQDLNLNQLPKNNNTTNTQNDENLKKIAELQKKLDEALKQIQDIHDSELKAHEFVMMDPSGVILRDGTSLSLGDTIQGGPWDGIRIRAIDINHRMIYLSNGSSVHLSSR